MLLVCFGMLHLDDGRRLRRDRRRVGGEFPRRLTDQCPKGCALTAIHHLSDSLECSHFAGPQQERKSHLVAHKKNLCAEIAQRLHPEFIFLVMTRVMTRVSALCAPCPLIYCAAGSHSGVAY